MPLHPTATTTRAAIRQRQARPDPAAGLRETDISTAIGDALSRLFRIMI